MPVASTPRARGLEGRKALGLHRHLASLDLLVENVRADAPAPVDVTAPCALGEQVVRVHREPLSAHASQVDGTTVTGKGPGEVARRCAEAGVRCVVFGGRVVESIPGAETVTLSGDPRRAAADLERLGEELGRRGR